VEKDRNMETGQSARTGLDYDNPKIWGDKVNKGDIFIVRREDAQNNGSYAEGDFYIAQFDGECSVNYYPGWGQDNEKWKHAWTGLSRFELRLENGARSGTMYGNGLNQIGVNVYFTAIDDQGRTVPLSDEVVQRAKVSLLNYVDERPLPGGWTYTETRNQFHTLPQGQGVAESFSDDSPRIKTYYLSCGKDERSRSVSVGSGISLPGGGVVTNSYRNFNNPVSVTALDPIFYTSSNTRLDREDTADGWHWDQDNYYFTITERGCRIIRVDIHGAPTGPSNWSIISKDKHPNWHYIWAFGPEGTARVEPLDVDLRYNQRENALCLTRLKSTYYNSGYDNWYFEVRFIIYDQYGNSGLFSAVRNEADWGNTLWVAEGDHTSKG
jgi:hypothetical protein